MPTLAGPLPATALPKGKRADRLFLLALAAGVAVVAWGPLTAVVAGYLTLLHRSAYLIAAHLGAIPLCATAIRWNYRAVVRSSLVGAALVTAWMATGQDFAVAVGFLALFRLAWSACGRAEEVAAARHAILGLLAVEVAVVASRVLSYALSASVTQGYDRYLYGMDAAFGYASFAVGRWFRSAPALAWICRMVYDGLPFGVVSAFALVRGTNRYRWFLILNFVVIGIVGRWCYLAVPAMGPAYEFPGQFPGAPPLLASYAPSPVVPHALYNAMPSLHTAWALMLFWWTGGQRRWLRAAAGVFTALTLLATLGLGEHYVIDLVVAVPFTAGTFALVKGAWGRCGVAFGMTGLWFVLLRWGVLATMPEVVWVLTVISLWVLTLRPRMCDYSYQ